MTNKFHIKATANSMSNQNSLAACCGKNNLKTITMKVRKLNSHLKIDAKH